MTDLRLLLAQNITRAREDMGLSQAEAARRLETDRQRLIGMEKGERPIDAQMLVDFSKIYNVDVSHLLGMIHPVKKVESFEPRFRGQPKLESERSVIEKFQLFCANYAKLLEKTGDATKPFKSFELDVAGSSRARRYAVEAAAAELRKLWDIGDVAPIGQDIFHLLAENGVTVYKTLIDEEGSVLAGASLKYPVLGSVILVNVRDTPQRQVFTAAHELGHLLYHFDEAETNEIFISNKFERNADEDLANDFASAFLMPSSGIKRHLMRLGVTAEEVQLKHVISLQRYFNVSYLAMLYRLKKLTILKGNSHFAELEQVRPVLEARGLGYELAEWEFSYEPKINRPEGLPTDFVARVLIAEKNGLLSTNQAAKYLEMTTQQYDAFLIRYNQMMMKHDGQLDTNRDDAIAINA
jgi:Zn-dependent peptidase ImmA (M78 family)